MRFLAFWGRFPFCYKDVGVSAQRKILVCVCVSFKIFLLFLVPNKQRMGDQGVGPERAEIQKSKSTPDPDTSESPAIHLPFLSRYFCKCLPSSWQKVVYTPPICIAIRLPFVSGYFCRSIRVRGRWNTPKRSRNCFGWRLRISAAGRKSL